MSDLICPATREVDARIPVLETTDPREPRAFPSPCSAPAPLAPWCDSRKVEECVQNSLNKHLHASEGPKRTHFRGLLSGDAPLYATRLFKMS